MQAAGMDLPMNEIASFCHRWKIARLEVFGSVLREDFRRDSDVDLLVTFKPGAGWSLFDHIEMQEELAALLGREVDLISRHAVEQSDNWIRRRAILESAEVLYAA